MNNEKKKILIVGALALVLVAVGAFTFIGGGSGGSGAVASTNTGEGAKAANTDEAQKSAADEGSGTTAGAQAGQSGEGAQGTPPGEDPAQEGGTVAANGQAGVGTGPIAATPFAPRDPFLVPMAYAANIPAQQTVEPPKPVQPTNSQPAGLGQSGGGFKPVDPMGGSLPGGGLPGPAAPAMVAKPMYRVKGILLGSKPMAVFEDGSGNQRLVPLGGSVDGDTKVVAIEKGKVKVSHKGKEHTLTIDEEARND